MHGGAARSASGYRERSGPDPRGSVSDPCQPRARGRDRTCGYPHPAEEIRWPTLGAQILDERRDSQKQEDDDEEPNEAHSPHHHYGHVGHLHHVQTSPHSSSQSRARNSISNSLVLAPVTGVMRMPVRPVSESGLVMLDPSSVGLDPEQALLHPHHPYSRHQARHRLCLARCCMSAPSPATTSRARYLAQPRWQMGRDRSRERKLVPSSPSRSNR